MAKELNERLKGTNVYIYKKRPKEYECGLCLHIFKSATTPTQCPDCKMNIINIIKLK